MRPDVSKVLDAHPGTTLLDVPWDRYKALRDLPANDRVRMSYLDGTLTFTSPKYIHEHGAEHFGLIVRVVSAAVGIPIAGSRSVTLQRDADDDSGGTAKEPDSSFYIGANEKLMRCKIAIDLDTDPPPDLAIEIDNKSDSEYSLPIYAHLRVPEVWRYEVRHRRLWFGHLVGGNYESIERSINLPRLTPSLILQALEALDAVEMDESTWLLWLMEWARRLPDPPAPQ